MFSEHLKILVRGDKFTIYGLIVNGCCEADDFLEAVSEKEKGKLVPLLHYTAHTGLLNNEQKFKNIGDGIFEFKGFQSRLFCFFDGSGIIILTHGCIKKRDKLNPADIKKARGRRDDFTRKGYKK